MPRIFSVRINLDDMFARLDALDTTEESAWLKGFRVGSRGGPLRPEWSNPTKCGYQFGLQAHQVAVGFSEKQSAKGKLRHSHGSATAEANTSHGSAISSNPVIQESKNEGTNVASHGSATAKPTPPSDILDGMDGDETPIQVAEPIPMEINWRDWRSHHGSIHVARGGEDGSPDDWEIIFRRYGVPCMDAMYERLRKDAPQVRIYYNVALKWLEENTKKRNAS